MAIIMNESGPTEGLHCAEMAICSRYVKLFLTSWVNMSEIPLAAEDRSDEERCRIFWVHGEQ